MLEHLSIKAMEQTSPRIPNKAVIAQAVPPEVTEEFDNTLDQYIEDWMNGIRNHVKSLNDQK